MPKSLMSDKIMEKLSPKRKQEMLRDGRSLKRRESIVDREDLAAFKERAKETTVSYERLRKKLKAAGKI